MIGALVALLSLDLTNKLVAAGVVAATLTITDASNTTPIVISTSAPHGYTHPAHGVVSGVAGNAAANGVWVMTPVTESTLSLTTFTGQGAVVNSVGSGVYVSGGTAQVAFPDGAILLGRQWIATQMSVVAPRIVFVPVGSSAWNLVPYGGVIPPATLPRSLAAQTAEQHTMAQRRQLNTETHRFEVHVTGCANPPDPSFGDFDVTQALYHALYETMFNLISPGRVRVLSGEWISQRRDIQLLDVRGQKWMGLIEIEQPVTDSPLSFVPTGTFGTLVVNFEDGASGDQTVIVVT